MTVSFDLPVDLPALRRRSSHLTPFQWTVYGLVSFLGHGIFLLLLYSLSQGPGGDRARNLDPQAIELIELSDSSAELLAGITPLLSAPGSGGPDSVQPDPSQPDPSQPDSSQPDPSQLDPSQPNSSVSSVSASDPSAQEAAQTRDSEVFRDSTSDRLDHPPDHRPNNLFRNPLQGLSRRITASESSGTLAETPPTENPPAESPPVENPPTETPPTESPPTETPPTENPPVESPPAESPPDGNSPTGTPPAEDPPTETPPDGNSPTATPPAETPPSEPTDASSSADSSNSADSSSSTASGESIASGSSSTANPSQTNQTLPRPGVGSTVSTGEPAPVTQPPAAPSQSQGTGVSIEGVEVQVLVARTRDTYGGRDVPDRFAELVQTGVQRGADCAIAPDEQFAADLNQNVEFLLIITDQGQVDTVNRLAPSLPISSVYEAALSCELRAARFLPAQQANKPTFGQVIVDASIRGKVLD